MGAIWVSERNVALKKGTTIALSDLLGPGSHGTTFGGTPLACAVANEVLSVIEEENLLSNARELGAYAMRELKAIGSPLIKDVRGVGLLLGIELSENMKLPGAGNRPTALAFVDLLHAAGLLSVPSGARALRWLPPLNVTRADIDEAVGIFRKVVSSL
jgi:acetylornithine/succinyldiaminopimelate/putrescine aminotransferase